VAEQIDVLREGLAGQYEVERAIGQGGMATVYLARDVRHDRKVAIKVLKPELAASIGHDRFLREIKLASQLQHPNILGFYESGEVNNLVYYCMPFVEGESLRDRIDKEKQLGIEDAVRIVREAGEALGYAHSHGIIHRDIKPENILLMNGHALVADFGIAKAVEAAGGEKLTETGMAVGTPHYMSPEQALGGQIDGRSDQYSLACVLYECLIGQTPFDGPSPMAVLARHAMEQVPSMQVVRNAIPDTVEDIVFRAMEKTPADRYASMKEFSEALEDAEADVHVQRTAARRASTASHRTPGGARATGRVTASTRRATTPIEIEARAPGGRKKALVGGAVALALVAAGLGFWKFKGTGGTGAATTADAGLDATHLAVLYFKSPPGSDSLTYLSEGLTEALIQELTKVSSLKVISSGGVSQFRTGQATPDSIGRTLKVGTLVQGRLAQSGDKLRATVSLVNASTGAEIGSTTIERPKEDIFALQDALAAEVSRFLRERLGQEVTLRQTRKGTSSVPAWETVLRAQQEASGAEALAAEGDSVGAVRLLDRADSLLAAAEKLDPKWATPAWRRGTLAYRRTRLTGSFDKLFYDEWTKRGLAHAERAVALGPTDADALDVRGNLKYWRYLLNLVPDPAAAAKLRAEAEADFRASVANNPTQASAWTALSHLLINKSETSEAKLAAMRAYEADPYLKNANVTLWRLFATSYDLEDPVESKHWCEEGHARYPKDPRFYECQIDLFTFKGVKPDVPKAWQLLAEEMELYSPAERPLRTRMGQMQLAAVLARAGLVDSAHAVIERARTDAAADPTRETVLLEAVARAILGEKDEAFRQLTTLIAANPQGREDMAHDQTWYFRELRSDPRWKTLVGQ
jgi:TolB-like protein/tRNA A-37 threonylcarbamoyl transferase component Bud32